MNNSRRIGTSEHLWQRMGQLDSNNFVMVAQLTGKIDEDCLRDALKEVVAAQVMLRTRATGSGKNARLSVDEECRADLTVMTRRNSQHWQAVAEQEMNASISSVGAPLWRLTWLRGESEHELLMTFNHMIADGRSGASFFEVLLGRINDATYEISANKLFPAYEDQLKLSESKLKFFKNFVKCLLDFRRNQQKRWNRFNSQPGGNQVSGLVSRQLSAPLLECLLKECRRQKTTVSCRLATVLTELVPTAEGAHSGISLAVDVRPFLKNDHRRDIGYFVTTVDLVKDAGDESSSWHLAREFKRTIAADCVRSQFKFDQLLRAYAVKFKKTDAGFKKLLQGVITNAGMLTNLGRLTQPTEYTDFKLNHCFHVPAVHLLEKPFICLATASLNGRMILNFTYPKAYFTQSQVEGWADQFIERLEC